MSIAVVSGVLGQDGAYLTRLLTNAGHRVVGLVRKGRGGSAAESDVELIEWEMTDQGALERLLTQIGPTQFYNLAAFSSGAAMFDDPVAIGEINGLAVTRILEAIRQVDPLIRFCQASSSEMFGNAVESPQRETTPFAPRTPYGSAKLYAHWMINNYRHRYGLFGCSAILFNHESPLRAPHFVTRKVTEAAASISLGLSVAVTLGNLDARRDWGFAGDYARAMMLMLNAEAPDDYVLATGETHSVRELCEAAFGHVGLDYRDHVRTDMADFRSDERRQLVGDATKARRELDWTPSLTFQDLVKMMVDANLERLRSEVKI